MGMPIDLQFGGASHAAKLPVTLAKRTQGLRFGLLVEGMGSFLLVALGADELEIERRGDRPASAVPFAAGADQRHGRRLS